MTEIAIGRKEIMEALHVTSWRTIQAWKKKDPAFKNILRTAPSERPFIVIEEAMAWFIEYDKLVREKRESKG